MDIARLRFLLAIIVDEEKPLPLPNLDYKIMQGNSLPESLEFVDSVNLKTPGRYTKVGTKIKAETLAKCFAFGKILLHIKVKTDNRFITGLQVEDTETLLQIILQDLLRKILLIRNSTI